MTALAQLPDAVNPGAWALLCGAMARRTGKRLVENPHPDGSPARKCWAYGWRHPERPQKTKAGRNVTRETHPGRGRARVGDRGQWSVDDLALLSFCSGGPDQVKTADMAAMLGRPKQGVRAKRCRVRKSEHRSQKPVGGAP